MPRTSGERGGVGAAVRRGILVGFGAAAMVVAGLDFALEWQFATTEVETEIRTAISDAIIGRVEDGRIIVWKEYLDGRAPELQRAGELGGGQEGDALAHGEIPRCPPGVNPPESPPPDRRSSPDAPGSGTPRW